MELQKGRPMDTTGRLAKETRTYDYWIVLGSNITALTMPRP